MNPYLPKRDFAPVKPRDPAGGATGLRRDAEGRISTDRMTIIYRAIAVFRQLETCLEQECAVLAKNSSADISEFISRKSQGLMELNSIVAALGKERNNSAFAAAATGLQPKIQKNLGILRMHLAAVSEISELLADAIRSADSDGTYSPAIRVLK